MTTERIVELELFIEREMKGNEALTNDAGCVARAKIDRDILACLKELKAHREAWKGLQHDVYELHKILFNMKPQHRSTTVAGDILGLIEAYRPKEGDVE